MVGDHQPFFTPTELKTLILWRPQKWRQWWSAEPAITKIFVAGLALLLAVGIYEHIRGNFDVSAVIFVTLCALAGVLVLSSVGMIVGAALRYVFRRSGIAAFWQKIRKPVLGTLKVIFWAGFGILCLVDAWPYLSLDPVKSWYAIKHKVPSERVHVNEEPHDCEFLTAPLGSKNCHYVGAGYVWRDEDGKKSLGIVNK
jgi:hypothetical protein